MQGIGGVLLRAPRPTTRTATRSPPRSWTTCCRPRPRCRSSSTATSRRPSAGPGGYKGVGEGGAIGAPPAVVNAVADALSPFGVTVTRLPLSPARIVELIERAHPPSPTPSLVGIVRREPMGDALSEPAATDDDAYDSPVRRERAAADPGAHRRGRRRDPPRLPDLELGSAHRPRRRPAGRGQRAHGVPVLRQRAGPARRGDGASSRRRPASTSKGSRSTVSRSSRPRSSSSCRRSRSSRAPPTTRPSSRPAERQREALLAAVAPATGAVVRGRPGHRRRAVRRAVEHGDLRTPRGRLGARLPRRDPGGDLGHRPGAGRHQPGPTARPLTGPGPTRGVQARRPEGR